MAKLIIQTGKLKGKPINIPTTEVVIGRDPECAIRMGSEEISRRHCALKQTDEGVLVWDLGSSNGTFVNGVAIKEPTLMQPLDHLRVGPAQFRVDGPKPPPLIDDDVAEWLLDGDSKVGMPGMNDTTILRPTDHKPEPVKAAPSPTTPPPPRPPHAGAKKYGTLAEESQDIIRRHFESLGEPFDPADWGWR